MGLGWLGAWDMVGWWLGWWGWAGDQMRPPSPPAAVEHAASIARTPVNPPSLGLSLGLSNNPLFSCNFLGKTIVQHPGLFDNDMCPTRSPAPSSGMVMVSRPNQPATHVLALLALLVCHFLTRFSAPFTPLCFSAPRRLALSSAPTAAVFARPTPVDKLCFPLQLQFTSLGVLCFSAPPPTRTHRVSRVAPRVACSTPGSTACPCSTPGSTACPC